MAIGGDESLFIFNTMLDNPIWQIDLNGRVNDVAFNERFLVIARDWSICVYDFL